MAIFLQQSSMYHWFPFKPSPPRKAQQIQRKARRMFCEKRRSFGISGYTNKKTFRVLPKVLLDMSERLRRFRRKHGKW